MPKDGITTAYIYFPTELHQKITAQAAQNGISLTKLIVSACAAYSKVLSETEPTRTQIMNDAYARMTS